MIGYDTQSRRPDGAKARVLKAYTLTIVTPYGILAMKPRTCVESDGLQRVQRSEDNPSTSSWVAPSLSSVTDRIAAGSHVLPQKCRRYCKMASTALL